MVTARKSWTKMMKFDSIRMPAFHDTANTTFVLGIINTHGIRQRYARIMRVRMGKSRNVGNERVEVSGCML